MCCFQLFQSVVDRRLISIRKFFAKFFHLFFSLEDQRISLVNFLYFFFLTFIVLCIGLCFLLHLLDFSIGQTA